MTGNYLIRERPTTDHGCKPINQNGRRSVRFEDLPEDVLYSIVSKLPPKEFARTSVLSSKWRCMWATCPRLSFNGVAMHKCKEDDLYKHTCKFIGKVNAVLGKYQGMVVEGLEVKFDFRCIPVHHLNNWFSFAVSSRTKNLAFDLRPAMSWLPGDRYIFPFELLDSESISRLQHIQLSFVSIKPPSQFRGFPNLRKPDLNLLDVTRKDLENVLSNCCNLEWLRINRCYLNNELMVDSPLSRLLYLEVVCCDVTKIEFHAVNLATFVYVGCLIPIFLKHALKLENANIHFFKANGQHALVALLNGLPNMRNLTLRTVHKQLEMECLWDTPCKFSHLRHLQLVTYADSENADKNYLVSFLRAAPFIEKLEIHFVVALFLWTVSDQGRPIRHTLGQCEYNYLKNMYITGFKGLSGQLELLLHVIENAPDLEVLTIETTELASEVDLMLKIHRTLRDCAAKNARNSALIARNYLNKKLLPKTKLCIL